MRLPKGRIVPVTLLVVLVMLDFILVAAAIAHRAAAPAGAPLATIGSLDRSPSSPAIRSPSPSPSAGSGRALPVDLAADGTALRAVAPGSCSAGGARLQWSDSGGARWRDVTSPARQVLRVQVAGGGSAWLAGADQRCQLRLWNTADGGRTWTLGDPVGAWSLLAQPSASQLHAPTGLVRSPCATGVATVDLAGLSETNAVLLCSNGNLYATQDGGSTWRPAATWPGARAVAADPTGQPVVLRSGVAGCAGVELDRGTAPASRGRLACIAMANPDMVVGMAFTSSGGGLIVTAAATYRTDNGGRTWRPA